MATRRGYLTNAWGHRVPQVQEVLADPSLRPLIVGLLAKVGGLVGLTTDGVCELLAVLRDPETGRSSTLDLERRFKVHLRLQGRSEKLIEAVDQRSAIAVAEIGPWLSGHSLLDIGCGNGLVARAVANRFQEIQLLDVLNYLDPRVTLPFIRYVEGAPLPIDRQWDTVLLLTVLHHSVDPAFLLREAWRATKHRLIIIESVFGVRTSSPSSPYALSSLSRGSQIGFAVLVDWLYNRVLVDDVPVPYNFTTPARWQALFAAEGMGLVEARNLGQDIDVAPELHYLFVLERSYL